MFCPKCGKEHTEKVNYCCYCGALMESGQRPAHKKLTLSRTDKKIAGVCGGFAEYLQLDSTLVRLIWVMLALVGGCGLLGYVVAWLVMPQAPVAQPTAEVFPAGTSPSGAQPATH